MAGLCGRKKKLLKSKTNKIVFNSFPRSGNVYQAGVSNNFFNIDISTAHLPEIFSVKEIGNVTIFRKPDEAISSLIMKQSKPESNMNKDEIEQSALKHLLLYKEYMNYARVNSGIIYIGKFNNLINDTVKHFEDISNYFNIDMSLNYKDNFLNAKLSGRLWDDRYDGHMPRPKDSVRLNIEEQVSSMSSIKDLNKDYEEFLYQYSTTV
jgi:hypothetical protein